MTDAKDVRKLGSKQYKEEWEEYFNVLKETKVEDRTKWLDLRGNHGKEALDDYLKIHVINPSTLKI